MYPTETEKALLSLCEAGVDTFEVFFNADCEIKGRIYNEIRSITAKYRPNILSVHPYTSAVETMSLFGNYQRRVDDIM